MQKENWSKTSFGKIVERLGSISKAKAAITELDYLVPLVVYGVAIIGLLRLSQFVLGWRF